MSATASVSLHRLRASRELRAFEFGYEVITPGISLESSLATIEWIDNWCPDAAQFVILDTPRGMSFSACRTLLDATEQSQFSDRLRFACRSAFLSEHLLVRLLVDNGIRLLLDAPMVVSLERATERGIVGVRIGAGVVARSQSDQTHADKLRNVLASAHELGLRSVASQLPSAANDNDLFEWGIDYVSHATEGIRPVDPAKWMKLGKAA